MLPANAECFNEEGSFSLMLKTCWHIQKDKPHLLFFLPSPQPLCSLFRYPIEFWDPVHTCACCGGQAIFWKQSGNGEQK